jgi:predicted nicotinamide N-methyase
LARGDVVTVTTPSRYEAFVRANTQTSSAPLVPEITLHLASEITLLWQATELELERSGVPPPYWAFAWAGGQAVARFVLDRPGWVAGRRVFDFASGCGIAAIAAARAGAVGVCANDIDPYSRAAIALNAAANEAVLETDPENRIGSTLGAVDVVLAGDVCYEQPMATRAMDWLEGLARTGVVVLLGDPGRAYLPKSGLEPLATYGIETTRELEDRDVCDTTVWKVLP